MDTILVLWIILDFGYVVTSCCWDNVI